MMCLVVDSRFQHRLEHFGSLLRNKKTGQVYQLGKVNTLVLLIYQVPRHRNIVQINYKTFSEDLGISYIQFSEAVESLLSQGIIIPTNKQPINLLGDIPEIKKYLEVNVPKKNIIKPFWAHLQPFTRCNQKCIHCYCRGGTTADPFLLSIEQWKYIIEKLENYGVFDIYVTGGENLMLPQFFRIASVILSKGLGFGLSTNASLITPTVLSRLRELNIKRMQVSLDGATPETYEFIRGASPGSFNRNVLKGLERLTEVTEVVINTVVNKLNFSELKGIIAIGQNLGVKKFKFFPQKNCGRSREYADILFNDKEIVNMLIPECKKLAKQYSTEIETIGSENCGSGTAGFAVEQNGDIYPCIFGVNDKTQCIGNILNDSLDDIWFNSIKLDKFRKLEGGKLCHRCEAPINLFE